MLFGTVLAALPLTVSAFARIVKRPDPANEHCLEPRRSLGSDHVANKYIVKMNDADEDSHKIVPRALAIDAENTFNFGGFRGFFAYLTSGEAEMLSNNPHACQLSQHLFLVEYVEEDSFIREPSKPSEQPTLAKRDAPWNLASFNNPSGGAGSCVYVVDTKVDVGHPDFEGRASIIGSTVEGAPNTPPGDHGTHVAGIVGSRSHGVAKKAKIFNVEVSNPDGGVKGTNFVAGMDLAVHHNPGDQCPNGRIINISIDAGFSQAWNDAAAAAVRAGFFVAAASGNQNTDVRNWSPASEPTVCTVGAIDEGGNRLYNTGDGVDVYAPGTNIVSLAPGGGTKTFSGTSMACPHVAGLAAYYLGLGDGGIPRDPQGLCGYIAAYH